MKKTLSIVLCVLLVLLAVACSPETKQHEHKYEKVAEKSYAATCKSTGLDVFSCTECGDTYSVTLPLTDHSHAEDAEPDYSLKGASEPNCVQTGLGWYTCQYCGTSFTEVVAKDPESHVYYDKTNKTYKKLDTASFKEDYMTWSETAEIEMSYFTPAQKVAYCNACGKKTDLTQVVEVSAGKYSYKNATGTWFCKDSETGDIYFLDVVEDKNQTLTSVETIAIDSDATSLSAKTAANSASEKTWKYSKDGVRSLVVDSDKVLTETDEGVTLTWKGKTVSKSQETSPVVFLAGHNHKYKTNIEGSSWSNSIYKDDYFELMTFLGTNLADSGKHYLECKTCGITCLGVSHKGTDMKEISATNSCSCGYWTNTDADEGRVYTTITIYNTLDPAEYTSIEEAANDAVTAAIAAAKYSGRDPDETYTAISSSDKYSDAAKKIGAVITALDNAENKLESYGKENNEVRALLTENSVPNYKTSLADCKKALDDAAKISDNNLAEDDTVLKDTNDIDELKAMMKKAVDSLYYGENYNNEDLSSASAANSKKGSIAYDLNNLKTTYTKQVDCFVCIKGSVLPVSFSSYTTSYGKTFEFAANTSWYAEPWNVTVVGDGLKVYGNGTAAFAENLAE